MTDGTGSWWATDDDDDDDEYGEYDESSVRTRPNPKGNRPRSKQRPEHADAEIARVLGVDRGRYTVLVDEDLPTERTVLAARARELRKTPIVTGDRARVVGDASGDEGTLARIVGIEDRTSLLRRSADDTDQVERVIVANADQMLVVVAAADPEPRPRLVDRYLVAALDAGIRPLLVVTKTDLADPAEFLAHFDGLDLEVFTSGREQMPLERIGAALVGHSTVFVGHSGVGKSTLVNALLGTERQQTLPIRAKDDRGRHATTQRELFVLPTGALLIDTPGMRLQRLAGGDGVEEAFDDVAELAARCRFSDCTHTSEPGCAVLEAIEHGRLDAARLEAMRKLEREARFAEERQGGPGEAARRARERGFMRNYRSTMDAKPRRE